MDQVAFRRAKCSADASGRTVANMIRKIDAPAAAPPATVGDATSDTELAPGATVPLGPTVPPAPTVPLGPTVPDRRYRAR